MSFDVVATGDFPHPILIEGVQVGASTLKVKARVEASESGKAVGFKMATCGIFLLDTAGAKHPLEPGAAFPAAPGNPAPPAAGSTVNVWIETPAAGEPWGPGSWAGGGLGAGFGLAEFSLAPCPPHASTPPPLPCRR